MKIDGKTIYRAKFKGEYLSSYAVTEDGDVYNINTKHKMTPYGGDGNYQSVSLIDDSGNKRVLSVHALVYESVTGSNAAANGYVIDHINGHPEDNRICNLQAITQEENVQRSMKGIKRSKPFHTNISNEVATDICKMLAAGYTPAEIVNIRRYSRKWVDGILHREYCLEISKDYVWANNVRAGISIPDSVIHGICQDLANGKGIRETARKWNVGHTTVAQIRDGKARTDISSHYDMSGLSDAEKLSLQTGEHVVEYVTKKGESTNLLVTNLGRFFRTGTLKEQNPAMQHNDLCVSIRINDGSKRQIPCKKVVAEMFCDNPNGYKDIVNIDGNLYNLKSTNLKYVSHSAMCKANIDYEMRRTYDGSYNPNAKLTDDEAQTVLIMHYELGMNYKSIAKQFNITDAAIRKLCAGEVRPKLYNDYMRGVYNNKNQYFGKGNLHVGIKW